MASIDDHLTQICDELTNLIHDDIQPYGVNYKKINVYNNNIKIPLQKIWLLTPKLKMLGKIYLPGKVKTAGALSLILYELDDQIKQFREFIDKLEFHAGEILAEVLETELSLKSSIKTSDTFFPSLTLQLPLDKKNIFDIDHESIIHESIDGGSFVTAYIELSDIWLNSSFYGINLVVLQMKVFPEFDFTKCIFPNGPPKMKRNIYNDNKENEHSDPMIMTSQLPLKKRGGPVASLYKPPDEKRKIEQKSIEQKSQSNPLLFMPPSIGDLLSVKNRLKSIKIENIEEKPDEWPEEIAIEEKIIPSKILKKESSSDQKIHFKEIEEQHHYEEIIEDGNQIKEIIETVTEDQQIIPPVRKMKKKIKKPVKKILICDEL